MAGAPPKLVDLMTDRFPAYSPLKPSNLLPHPNDDLGHPDSSAVEAVIRVAPDDR